jgi:modulator of FtsH protease HflK
VRRDEEDHVASPPRYPDLSDRPRRTPEQEEIERRLRAAEERARFWAGRLWPLALGVVVLLWAASGVYTVQPGEVGVVRHFGFEVARTGPGLNYHLPWPVQVVDVINVEAIRRSEIGFRTQDGAVSRVNTEALMLTGDENIVDAQVIVQYRVSDPSRYLFRLRDPDEALRAATEVALRSAIGKMKIDDVLTTGRGDAQERTRVFLQQLLDTYESGLQVTEVKLQVVDPPEQVKDAFQEVVRAREDRERLTNEARAYREDILPKARGQAQETIRAAEGYEEQRVIQARGDVAKFAAVLQEYLKSKEVTRDRLHLETIERALARVDKIVLDPQASGNTTPLLPLRGLQEGPARQTAAAAAAQGAAAQPTAQPSAPTTAPAPQPTVPGPGGPGNPAPAKPAPAKP